MQEEACEAACHAQAATCPLGHVVARVSGNAELAEDTGITTLPLHLRGASLRQPAPRQRARRIRPHLHRAAQWRRIGNAHAQTNASGTDLTPPRHSDAA